MKGRSILIALLFGILVIIGQHAEAAYAVAVIKNYNDVISKIQIIREDSASVEVEPYLYEGDKIVSDDFNSVDIIYEPYADLKTTDENEVTIMYHPPSMLASIFQSIKDRLIPVEENKEQIILAISKGLDKSVPAQFPLPGYSATVLPNHFIHFAWGSTESKQLVIKNIQGKKVFSQDISSLATIDINPNNIGLKSGAEYVWIMDGDKKSYNIKILDEPTTAIINKNLQEIDAENIPEANKKIEKVLYLQFVSDTYPQRVDLYGLSYEILLQIDSQDTKIQEMNQLLQRKFKRHLDGQM